MANRYGNQNYGRDYERRGDWGSRSSSRNERGGQGSDYGRRSDTDYSFGGEDDREENYFGSGRQQFGQGYTGSRGSFGRFS